MATAKSQVSSIDDAQPEVAEVHAPILTGLPGASGERSILTIHSHPGADGLQDVDCGINGYGFQIKRDTPVNVPTELVTMLESLIVTTYDPNGVPRDRPRFALSHKPA